MRQPKKASKGEWAWPVLLVSLAGGMSLQSIASSIVMVGLVVTRKWPRSLPQVAKSYLIVTFLWLLWMALATLMNVNNPADSRIAEHVFGYLPLMILPVLLIEQSPKPYHRLVCIVFSAVAIISLSQFFFGWSLHHLSGGVNYRPHGLYGHPLTLAYVSLLVWPLAVYWWWRDLGSWSGWLVLVSVAVVLLTTDSRSCQVAAAIVALLYLVPRLSWKRRGLFMALVVVTASAIFFTDNPVSDRYRTTFSEDNPQRFSDYPDDRLAFWHAHYFMIKERPVVGHGIRLNSEYRQPYYEKIGLGDFIRRYSAHNLYIQVTAEGGVIGLTLFLAWCFLLWRMTSSVVDDEKRAMFRLTLLAVGLASLTQNSLMDATFRNVSSAMIAWIMYEVCRSTERQSKASI